ncbi:MAG: endo-1,4-beta-xylanase, partial [Methanothermobacter tenebrarum]
KNAGFEVSPEQVQEGLTYQVLEDTESNPFVVGVYNLDESLFPEEYSDLAGPIPLFIARQNEKKGEWGWGKNVLRGHGVSIGFSGWYPNNIEIIRTEANRLVSAWEFIFDNYQPPLIDNRGTYHFEQTDNVVRLARSNNLEIRAQDLLYGVPSYIENRQNTKDELLTFIENHIRMTVQRYKGKVDQWSVANEIMQPWGDASFLYDYFGPNDLRWLVLAFNTAHEVDPNATLILNDTGIEFLTTHPRWLSRYSDRFWNLVNQLKEQGAPINAVGFQMHLYAEDYTTEEQLNNAILSFQENIRRYKALGIDVIITEWDIRLGSLSNYSYEERILLQTKIYQRFLFAALESGVTDISFFSVNDEDSWLEDPNIGGQNASLNDPCLFTHRRPKLPYYAVLRTLTFFNSVR